MAPVSRPAVRAWRKFSSNCAAFTPTSPRPSPPLRAERVKKREPAQRAFSAPGRRRDLSWARSSRHRGAKQRAESPDVVAEFHAVNEGLDLASPRGAEHVFGRSAESCAHVRGARVDDVFQTDAVRGAAGFAHFHFAALLSGIRLGHGLVYLQLHDVD